MVHTCTARYEHKTEVDYEDNDEVEVDYVTWCLTFINCLGNSHIFCFNLDFPCVLLSYDFVPCNIAIETFPLLRWEKNTARIWENQNEVYYGKLQISSHSYGIGTKSTKDGGKQLMTKYDQNTSIIVIPSLSHGNAV